MGSDILPSLIIIVICIILSAYFSATETAFSSLNRIRVKNMANNGDRKAQKGAFDRRARGGYPMRNSDPHGRARHARAPCDRLAR